MSKSWSPCTIIVSVKYTDLSHVDFRCKLPRRRPVRRENGGAVAVGVLVDHLKVPKKSNLDITLVSSTLPQLISSLYYLVC